MNTVKQECNPKILTGRTYENCTFYDFGDNRSLNDVKFINCTFKNDIVNLSAFDVEFIDCDLTEVVFKEMEDFMEPKLVGQTVNGNFIVDYYNKQVILPLGGLAVPKDLSPQSCWYDNTNWGEIDDLWWEHHFPEFPKSIPYQSTLTDQEKQLRIKNSELYKEFCERLETLTKEKIKLCLFHGNN